MTMPEDAARIDDVVRDVSGETLAAARTMGAGAPVLAFDVGGTDIKSALFDADGVALGLRRTPTPVADGDRTEVLIERLGVLAAELTADHPDVVPQAAGLVVPGIVDEAKGVAVWSSNVGFRDVPMRALLAERLGMPAALGHDVRAGGMAEARLGAGRGEPHVLFLAIGTGIAAAHVVDGRAFAGAHGAAGEVGHVIVRPGGPPCLCGSRGCLEAVASASAVGRRYAELSGIADAAAFDVAARAAAGEPLATAVWTEAVEALADGLLTAQALYDAGIVVLGGGLAEAGEALLVPLRTALDQRITFHRIPRLVRAQLGDTAGCLGAALLALDLEAR